MICRKCGADISEDKIYCEKCGAAVQIVPDYNPAEDIFIETEEMRNRKMLDLSGTSYAVWMRRWRCGLAGLLLLFLGVCAYQSARRSVGPAEVTVTKSEGSNGELTETKAPALNRRLLFSLPPGTYSYSPMLTMTYVGSEEGDIHYTTDGTTPDEKSAVYRMPVPIEEGTTVVRAVFIRLDGEQSEEASGTYHVVFRYPDEPVFSIPSGVYEGGISVDITAEENCRIYYTIDGGEPGPGSTLYQGPIYIAPGRTVLQAVSVTEDGGTSAIVEAVYDVSEFLEGPEEGNAGEVEEEP